MHVFVGIPELLTMAGEGARPEERLGVIDDAALAVDDGAVAWVGPRSECPYPLDRRAIEVVDLEGHGVVVPGLVDCHTHLVFAGERAADFEARCRGESYAAIARRGGGIATTTRATRAASKERLIALARERLDRLLAAGVTTVEIKSGYGLTVTGELKQLEVAAALAVEGPQRIVPTLLLHIVPPEYAERREEWVRVACDELVPTVAKDGLARAVDVFCDTGAFTAEESHSILSAAVESGLAIKAHVEQLTHTGFGSTAASMGALSLEHLEQADEATITAMAASGTVAVLLPTASLFLGDPERPPVAALREGGVPMAVATDLNPGSSPVYDPWLAATLACTWYGLTPAEALLGMTVIAARALGLQDGTGTLVPGARADFAVARVASWPELLYGLGHAPIAQTWVAGQRVLS